MSKQSDKDRSDRPERKSYSSPALREFGPVGRLTQSGTGQARENMSQMGTDRRP